MSKNTIPLERDWRVEDYVRALIRAEEIKNDKSRMAAAKKKASQIAEEKQKEVKAARKIAGRKK